ncbi:hypothetical protein DFP72DRAFT_867025 [Ephemerocybe angulata]|uniref:Uncharacterized protein n=1 Tax=Ephemerocybe angulata TaxID=980116 RepID=A0A8H6IJG1_9AGAR|nr:hypothetical protein DFP72DRAFT_867025 [Tulosesus angulatus]
MYPTCSSLANLQCWRSKQLPVMVVPACCSYSANRAFSIIVPERTDTVSAAGAFAIGVLGTSTRGGSVERLLWCQEWCS